MPKKKARKFTLKLKKISYFIGLLVLLVGGLTYYIEKNKDKSDADFIGTIYTEYYVDAPECVESCEGNKKKLSCKDRVWDEGISSLFKAKYKECTFLCDGVVTSVDAGTGEVCERALY
jgi:hypothetical protein